MKRELITLSLVAFSVLLSCQREEIQNQTPAQLRSAKIVNPTKLVLEDVLAVKLNSDSSEELYSLENVSSLERMFPSVKGKEALEKKHGLDKWYLLHIDGGESPSVMADKAAGLSSVSIVQYCSPIQLHSDKTTVPYSRAETKAAAPWSDFNDPLVNFQWHYHNNGDLSIAPTAKAGADINLKPAWKFCTGDPSVIVAVLDEGVYYDHPDLKQNIWTNEKEIPDNGIDDDGNGYVDDIHGYNFVSEGSISWNKDGDSGHGTHVAGTIAAVNNNGIGVCGIAGGNGKSGGVKIMSCQQFDGKDVAGDYNAARAFKYAADNGASIVQCSWGYPSGTMKSDSEYKQSSPLTVAAIEYFLDTDNCPNLDGGVIIFSAGNNGKPMPGYPAAYYKNIAVAATASDNLPTYYTNYGPGTNISAPGGEYFTGGKYNEEAGVLSTLPYEFAKSGYGYMEGTSMACPHVTGVAALGLSYIIQRGIHMTNNEFMSKLLTSVNDIDSYLVGEKMSNTKMNLAPYRKNMGTGTIDTWRFFMQIDGNPCLVAETGKNQRLDISDYFGGCAANLTYLQVSIDKEDKESLGLEQDPEIAYGKLKINPTKSGCGVVHIKAVAGGERLGTGEGDMGGIELNRSIAIISRYVKPSNGGWL